jgi:hypothetical protein
VSRDACDQIERKARQKICRVFNEFCPGNAHLITDVERAGGAIETEWIFASLGGLSSS